MAKFFASFGKLRLSSYSSQLLILALLVVPFPAAAAVSITYELVARSGVTTVPGSTVKFNGFGAAPAIDKQGNVVFTGGGTGRFGVYTALGGTCCQIVADNFTLVPGSTAKFYDFSGAERHDIDNGRVAFKAKSSVTRTALYSNVGQASASTLVEVTALDNVEWSVLGDPWVDGTTVGIYGNRLIPSAHNAILLWNGATGGKSFVNPGTGYNVGYNSQASLAGNAAILARAKTGSFQMGISSGSTFEVLATANQTVMPDLGVVFTNFYPYPVVDDGGQDAAFVGYGNPNQGLFKRVNGGALQNVVDNTTPVPLSGGNTFTIIFESAIALANGQVLFGGMGQSGLKGVYTDVGGALAVLFDNGLNKSIVVGGQTLGVSNFDFSTRSFAYTPQGYMAVFRLDFVTGGSAIVRAKINAGSGTTNGTFTVRKDFSNNNTASVSVTLSCTSGTIATNPKLASEGAPAVFSISGATAGTTCKATEPTVPSGYTRNQTDCQNGDPLNGSCTIINTLNTTSTNTFTVRKDFSNNNPASVSVTLSCTSGTIATNPKLASEGTPAVFSISGATAGTTCKATEPTIPTGYTRNQTDCQNGDPLNGSCTIINTAISNPGPVTILNSNFETGQSTGWATSGDVAIDSATAVGQYSLRLSDNGASATRTVSTAGYTAVSVTMKLAVQSLEGNDACFAEISTNGGSSWTGVLSLSSSSADGSFFSGTVSPAAASNNSNLRLRARLTGNGNGDDCWLDDVKVVGTASSSTQSASSEPLAFTFAVNLADETTFDVGAESDEQGLVTSGFDPGFDHLVGDGGVSRSELGHDELMFGPTSVEPFTAAAFDMPVGAGQPEHQFSGTLELPEEGLEVSTRSSGQSPIKILPEFAFDFVQVDNHLFPVQSHIVAGDDSTWQYTIGTGRVWREDGDSHFSRASIPFSLAHGGTGCTAAGRVTFLFQDDGSTSRAAYQVTGSGCGTSTPFELWGLVNAAYLPGTTILTASDIAPILGCAADSWLPVTIETGGMSMALGPEGSPTFVLSGAGETLEIDARDSAAVFGAVCQ